jgi:hypothetical protein
MTINLKDFVSDKEVIVTFQNGAAKRGYVIRNHKMMLYPYAFSGRGYYYDGSTGIGYHGMSDIRFLEEETPEPKPNMNPNKSDFYNSLSAKEQALYDVTKDEISAEWVDSLAVLISELGCDEVDFDLIFRSTPEEAVNILRKRIETLVQLAADEELDACSEVLYKRYSGAQGNLGLGVEMKNWLLATRRPEKTLKQKALEDLKSLKELTIANPEILDNIENALNSLSDSTT